MFLLKLHEIIKQNYESGFYSHDYTYKAKNYNYAYKKKDFDNSKFSDFNMGRTQARHDYRYKKKFKNYPKSLIVFMNFISRKKLQEIIDFINGYNYEKEILKNKNNISN